MKDQSLVFSFVSSSPYLFVIGSLLSCFLFRCCLSFLCQVYAWMDSKLREIAYLVKDVCWEARDRHAVWKFRLVYPGKIHQANLQASRSTQREMIAQDLVRASGLLTAHTLVCTDISTNIYMRLYIYIRPIECRFFFFHCMLTFLHVYCVYGEQLSCLLTMALV